MGGSPSIREGHGEGGHRFYLDHIICQFGIPTEIVYDNGKQFIGNKVSKFLEDHNIKRILSTRYHPSGNGQAESMNKTKLQSLKKRLTDAKEKWKEILPEVLWAYRTTSMSSIGATPFVAGLRCRSSNTGRSRRNESQVPICNRRIKQRDHEYESGTVR